MRVVAGLARSTTSKGIPRRLLRWHTLGVRCTLIGSKALRIDTDSPSPHGRRLLRSSRGRLGLAALAVIGVLGALLALSGQPRTAVAAREDETTSTSTSESAPSSTSPSRPRLSPIIYRPANLPATSPAPLVVALHPGGGTPAGFEQNTGFDSLADQYGFVVAYLDSPPPEWKAPSEITYVGSMISQVKASQNIDPQRVYVVGFSIGGYAAFRSGCEFAGQVAAIAIVSTAMAPLWRIPCSLSRPVSELDIAGTEDEFPVHQTTDFPISADQTAAAWRTLNGCSPESQTTQVGPTVQTTWSRCNDGTSVAEYVVNGGSHAWPGAPGSTGADAQYNATQAVWSFLSQHRGTAVATAEAQLVSLGVKGGLPRKVQGVVRVSESAVQVQLTVASHRHTVASKTFNLLQGSRALPVITVPRSVPKGPGTITLTVSDSYGRRLTISRTVQIPGSGG